MSDNGKKNGTPIPFPSNVPIVGQLCEVLSWFPTMLIKCKCQDLPMLIVGLGSVATCPSCQKSYMIAMIEHDQRTGNGKVGVMNVIVPKPEAPAVGQPG